MMSCITFLQAYVTISFATAGNENGIAEEVRQEAGPDVI